MSLSDDDCYEDDNSEDDNSEDKILTTARTEQFSKFLSELEHYTENEQIQKIEDMNMLIDKMEGEEFNSILSIKNFNEIGKLIEERKLMMKNAVLLLRHMGHRKMLKNIINFSFDFSILENRLEKIIIEEEKEKENENEKLMIDLCECYLLLCDEGPSMRVFNISFHCLLKIALKKEENEEVQKEVEMSLLALSHIQFYSSIDKEPYLNEIKKIIEYHQEHYNLTRLAYQSAWKFLMDRYYEGNNSKWVIENELCFAREAAKELEDLSKCVDWKRKEEKMEGKEMKEVHIVNRWINVINNYLECCTLWNEELVGLIGGVVNVFRQAKDNYKNITKWCIFSFRGAVQNKNIEIDSLQKEGVVDLISEKMKQSTLQVEVIWDCLEFFLTILKRLKEKTDDKAEEVKRKANKKKMLEKLEEDGYEDVITSFHETIDCFHQQLKELTKNTFDYFVNA